LFEREGRYTGDVRKEKEEVREDYEGKDRRGREDNRVCCKFGKGGKEKKRGMRGICSGHG